MKLPLINYNLANLLKVFTIFCLFLTTIAFAAPIKVAVSILPLEYLVKRIGGERVEVTALVAGMNPETYEPRPDQVANLANAQIYYTANLPFEKPLLNKIKLSNPRLKIIDLWQGIKLRELNGGIDPHLWTSPKNTMVISNTIYKSLTAWNPTAKNYYKKNYQNLLADLEQLDHYLKNLFNKTTHKVFLVYHPTWGYFADSYGLKQLAIEAENKETGPQDLVKILQQARAEHIKVIFIQPQFSKNQGQAIAKMLNGKMLSIDPLAENYLENMKKVAQTIAETLNQ